jgi:hypothetical protein
MFESFRADQRVEVIRKVTADSPSPGTIGLVVNSYVNLRYDYATSYVDVVLDESTIVHTFIWHEHESAPLRVIE